MNTFLLIDNAMLSVADGEAILGDERYDCLACLYADQASTVSPYLIDLYAAHEAGMTDWVMTRVNATPEKLHVSIIDTALSHAELAQHFRRFIMVKRAGAKNATLRFADCTVLPQLARTFTPEQWAVLMRPIARWRVHGYDGALTNLPGPDVTVSPSELPMLLTEHQVTTLHEAMMPNNVLGCLRAMRHGAALPGNVAEQHRWASEAIRLWHSTGNTHDIVVRWLADAALDTNGDVLRQEPVSVLLAQSDLQTIRTGLYAAVAKYRANLTHMGESR